MIVGRSAGGPPVARLEGPPGRSGLTLRAGAEIGYDLNGRHEKHGKSELGFDHGRGACPLLRKDGLIAVSVSAFRVWALRLMES
jgi:hypothetical protein